MSNSSPLMLVDKTGSIAALNDNLTRAVQLGAQSVLLLATETLDLAPDNFDQMLKSLPIPVCGGVFPQLIAKSEFFNCGSIVLGFSYPIAVCNVKGLSDTQPDYVSQMQSFADKAPSDSALLIFVDGTSSRLNFFLEECFGVFGSDHQYLGGGAGTLGLKDKPCIFSNDGMTQHCAQIVSLQKKMTTNVTHGWDKLDGPFLVTASERNRVDSLDFRPAFEVYREVIRNRTGENVPQKGFFSISKNYPIGLSQINGQVVVRDPVSVKGHSLVCVGEVPENHVIYILRGDEKHLLSATKNTATDLGKLDHITAQAPALVFDCISRLMYLNNRFNVELGHINSALPANTDLIGALSIGEISCSGDTCLELFNKSMVMGVFVDE